MFNVGEQNLQVRVAGQFRSVDELRLLPIRAVNPATGVASSLRRGPGVQVWVEDPHRECFDQDFGPGGKPGVVRLVGAANGTYSAQIVVG